MDIVFLQALRIDTTIGIYDWEREIRQSVVLDIEMGTDISKAAASDHIDDTLDYKAVAKRLIDFVGNSEFQLVETLAEEVCRLI
ncbi:dihydroneopterin aldolase, partial [Solemya velum gill symbiont]